MRIEYLFYSLKNYSELSYAERFVKILESYGFNIEKVGRCEPIRNEYSYRELPEIWKWPVYDDGYAEGGFLFKGKDKFQFSGMISWHINLPPHTGCFNSIHLWLNAPKKIDFNELLDLGDDIFTLFEAEYGYIMDRKTTPQNDKQGNIGSGLEELMWSNYFGNSYLRDSEFKIPEAGVSVGHGIRVTLSQKPNDEKLANFEYLQSRKEEIGEQWFWSKPLNYKLKTPVFDKSEICRKYMEE